MSSGEDLLDFEERQKNGIVLADKIVDLLRGEKFDDAAFALALVTAGVVAERVKDIDAARGMMNAIHAFEDRTLQELVSGEDATIN
jgi:hypothetical protein